MARYRKIDVRMWGDAKFRRLTPPPPGGQALWWYLLTNPNTTNIPGLYRAGESQIAEELGWPLKGFREAFQEVSREGLVEVDWGARLIWIPGAVRYHVPESPNVVKSWATTWDELPECGLKAKAFQILKAFTEGLGEGFRAAFAKACMKASPKPLAKAMANQEQEQEQEQEQDRKPEQTDVGLAASVALVVTRPLDDKARIAEVVDHYRTYHPRAFPRGLGPTSKEGKALRAVFRDGYSVDDVRQAIDGYHVSPFHLGLNERNQTYLDLGLIVRDAQHVQKGIEMQQRGPPAGMSQRELASEWAIESWASKAGGDP